MTSGMLFRLSNPQLGLLLFSYSQNTQRELKYIKNTHYKVTGALCLLPSKPIIPNFSLNVALDETARTG
jgi:hypothetical protein